LFFFTPKGFPNILRFYGSKNKQRAMLSMPEGRETLVSIRELVPIQNEMVTVNVVNKAIHLRGNSLPCPIILAILFAPFGCFFFTPKGFQILWL
jgi:hypothetical protein